MVNFAIFHRKEAGASSFAVSEQDQNDAASQHWFLMHKKNLS
jgi:hypothetical protein